MEFATCKACNNGTRGADTVAAFMARISPHDVRNDWRWAEALELRRALKIDAPGVYEEFVNSLEKTSIVRNGVIIRGAFVSNTPMGLGNRYLDIFASKFAMAIYRHACGKALPLNGEFVYGVFLNAGLRQEDYELLLSIMPINDRLAQGEFVSDPQFSIRMNTDRRGIVISLAHFNDGLHIFSLSYADKDLYGRLQFPEQYKRGQPGHLLEMLPPRPPQPPFKIDPSGLLLPRSIRRPRRR
ncbi:hypothetical protein LRS73_18035 [Methylobacterium currus]|uniref:hypothetical protein n=1 Tax=Methylobacterium currus TaxID=2051553 RepID=UPI001E2A389C|nr:hypothetical protein [Methylobacterium currus]UHC14448.1 hypothetical protein LRS73_18035 [Methylobacterium currus]